MSLTIYHEHLEYTQRILRDPYEYQKFVDELTRKSPEFVNKVEELLVEFLKNCGIDRHNRFAISVFLQHTWWLLVPLLCANSGELPSDILRIYDEISGDRFSMDRISERETVLGVLNSDWIMGAKAAASHYGLYPYGTGSIYALADAFLEAKKQQEKREADAADAAQRTKTLIPDWIDGIEIDLHKGEKNIGEV